MTHQIQWRLKESFRLERCSDNMRVTETDDWHDLEYESWPNPIHAEDRLKYWSHLSLSSLIEFRVKEVCTT